MARKTQSRLNTWFTVKVNIVALMFGRIEY